MLLPGGRHAVEGWTFQILGLVRLVSLLVLVVVVAALGGGGGEGKSLGFLLGLSFRPCIAGWEHDIER